MACLRLETGDWTLKSEAQAKMPQKENQSNQWLLSMLQLRMDQPSRGTLQQSRDKRHGRVDLGHGNHHGWGSKSGDQEEGRMNLSLKMSQSRLFFLVKSRQTWNDLYSSWNSSKIELWIELASEKATCRLPHRVLALNSGSHQYIFLYSVKSDLNEVELMLDAIFFAKICR